MYELGVAEHACNPNAQEAIKTLSRVIGHPQLYKKQQESLSYMKPYLKT